MSKPGSIFNLTPVKSVRTTSAPSPRTNSGCKTVSGASPRKCRLQTEVVQSSPTPSRIRVKSKLQYTVGSPSHTPKPSPRANRVVSSQPQPMNVNVKTMKRRFEAQGARSGRPPPSPSPATHTHTKGILSSGSRYSPSPSPSPAPATPSLRRSMSAGCLLGGGQRSRVVTFQDEAAGCFSPVLLDHAASTGTGTGTGAGGERSHLTVAVRIRPPLAGEPCTVSADDSGNVCVRTSEREHTFAFDLCFDADTQQQQVFACLGEPLLRDALRGYNVCLFAYGQTGSGKTHSMMGGGGGQEGVIPRFAGHLFHTLDTDDKYKHTKVEISYFEIYNEKIHDLLGGGGGGGRGRPLRVREHPELGPYVVDLTAHTVHHMHALQEWLRVGAERRATAATEMNVHSSRSHSIFTITLTQPLTQDCPGLCNKINLVDLAGSERITGTAGATPRLKECVSINRSLLTLGKVISSLAEGGGGGGGGPAFVPYRESVLTWLLRESLGGNSRTAMLATVRGGGGGGGADESLSTLRYASVARRVVNTARRNETTAQRRLRELTKENRRLREELQIGGAGEGGDRLREALRRNLAYEQQVVELRREVGELTESGKRARGEWEEAMAQLERATAQVERSEAELRRRGDRDTDKQVAQLEEAVRRGEAKRADLMRRLDEREGKVEAMQRQLENRDREVEVVQRQLQNRDLEVEAIEAQLEMRDQKVEAIQRRLEKREEEMRAIQSRMENRDREEDVINRKLENRDQEVEAIQRQLNKKDREMQVIQRQLEKRDQEVQAIQRQLEKRDREVHAIQLQLECKDREIEAVQRQLEKREEEMQTNQSQLENRDRKEDMINRELKSKDQELEAIQRQLMMREEEMQRELEKRNRGVRAIERQMERIQGQLDMSLQEVEAIRRQLEVSDRETEAIERQLDERNQEVEAIRQQLEKREEEMQTIQSQLEERDREVEAIRRQLMMREEEMQRELEERNRGVRAIEWQMERLDRDMERIQGQLEERERETEAIRREMEEREGEVEVIERQLDERNQEVEAIRQQQEKREEEMQTIQSQLEERDGEVEAIRRQLEKREVEVKEMRAENDRLKKRRRSSGTGEQLERLTKQLLEAKSQLRQALRAKEVSDQLNSQLRELKMADTTTAATTTTLQSASVSAGGEGKENGWETPGKVVRRSIATAQGRGRRCSLVVRAEEVHQALEDAQQICARLGIPYVFGAEPEVTTRSWFEVNVRVWDQRTAKSVRWTRDAFLTWLADMKRDIASRSRGQKMFESSPWLKRGQTDNLDTEVWSRLSALESALAHVEGPDKGRLVSLAAEVREALAKLPPPPAPAPTPLRQALQFN